MSRLRLYAFLSRARWLGYRGKILGMAFTGTHVPLLAIIAFVVIETVADFNTAMTILLVALVATLLGTGVTLLVLNGLLQPVTLTATALRAYREQRKIVDLPTGYTDEAGRLMADAAQTLRELDGAIDELAHYDRPTGLPNRLSFLQEAEARIEKGGPFVVCAVEFVGYDRIVGAFSGAAADEALRMLVDRMKAFVGEGTFVARTGGGMLVCAFDYDGDTDALTSAVEGTYAALRKEVATGHVRLIPEVAIGLAIHPQDGATAEALLDHALAAVNTAGPRDPVQFYSSGTRAAARERFLTEQDLRRALSNAEFVLHYQPVVDLDAGRIVSGEALIRWQHPERGLLPPGAFIEIAEASGLIAPIGAWVIDSACRQLGAWKDTPLADLSIAINISARQFHDPALIRLVAQALWRNGVAPARLEIEMTETAAMEDKDHARRVVHELHDLGVSVAIDDFGTGYSAMASLLDMPFDTIKIDRSFVSGVADSANSRAICAAMLTLSHGLGVSVQAEGTETAEQVRVLNDLGCNRFQGFFFDRPLTVEAFAHRVAASEPLPFATVQPRGPLALATR